MEEEKGDIKSPIWLIGDSPPKRYEDVKHPFDTRHPAVHNIWTPIAYKIQSKIYKEKSIFFDIDDDNKRYILNAVTGSDIKPKDNAFEWDNAELDSQLRKMTHLIKNYKPAMIITFGAFAFEFIRRCDDSDSIKYRKYGYWGAKNLGKCFLAAIEKKRIVSLLHISISYKWLSSHRQFTNDNDGNYFDFVSDKLYPRFIEIYKI